MKKNKLTFIFVILAIIVFMIGFSYFQHKNDVTVYSDKDGLPTIVVVVEYGCHECRAIKNEVQKVFEKYKDFVNIQFYFTSDKGAKDKISLYNLALFPSSIFLDKDNNIIKTDFSHLDYSDYIKIITDLGWIS